MGQVPTWPVIDVWRAEGKWPTNHNWIPCLERQERPRSRRMWMTSACCHCTVLINSPWPSGKAYPLWASVFLIWSSEAYILKWMSVYTLMFLTICLLELIVLLFASAFQNLTHHLGVPSLWTTDPGETERTWSYFKELVQCTIYKEYTPFKTWFWS